MAVIGQGYVGLPLALSLVKSFGTVYGIDVDSERVKNLLLGLSPTPDVERLDLVSALTSSSYIPTIDFSMVSKVQVVIVCVPTPLTKDGKPDLSYLSSAMDSIKMHVQPNTLIVSESTSYPGTLRWIRERFGDLDCFESLKFAVAPERINPADRNWGLSNTPRLIGAVDEKSLQEAKGVYLSVCNEVITVDSPEIAETAKLFENTFRLVNIGLVNELRQLCFELDVDFQSVLEAADTKPYGFMRFNPSAGVGGHCIPVDPAYLQYAFEEIGLKSAFIELALAQNARTAEWVCERVLSIIKSGTVLLVGVSYKPNVADTRESATERIAEILIKRGFKIEWTDPLVDSWKEFKKWDEQSSCDLALIIVRHDLQSIDNVLGKAERIIDLTKKLPKEDNGIRKQNQRS